VFSSHIVSDIERLANKIWILKAGKLYWQGDLDSLKESIVRVHIRSPRPLPDDLAIPNALSIRREESHAIVVACNWTTDMYGEIERRAGAQLDVEELALEEIFLELHR
jgi:ABC-2 type transport system ATP-binding protein